MQEWKEKILALDVGLIRATLNNYINKHLLTTNGCTNLSTFHIWTHLIFSQLPCEESTIIFPVISMKKVMNRNIKYCPRLPSLQVKPKQMTLEPYKFWNPILFSHTLIGLSCSALIPAAYKVNLLYGKIAPSRAFTIFIQNFWHSIKY